MPNRIRAAVQPEDRFHLPHLRELTLVEILELLVEDPAGDSFDPFGDCVPFRVHAAEGSGSWRPAPSQAPPVRTLFVYIDHGVHEDGSEFFDPSPGSSRWLPTGVCVALAGAVALADLWTGTEISLLPMYAAPVAAAAWIAGARSGLGVSVATAIALLVVDSVEHPRHPGFAYWNALGAGAVFAAMALALSRLHDVLRRERSGARVDTLTGARTQRDFYEAVELEIRRAERAPRPMTLAYIDIDDFRRFNDHAGRDTGDQVLRRTAEVLKKNTRVTDLVGRVGGDEFAVLLPETDPDGAMAVLWKLRRRLQRAMDKRKWPLTFSIGAVTFTRAPRDAEDIVRRADRLVVTVKLEGKNQVRHETVAAAPRAIA